MSRSESSAQLDPLSHLSILERSIVLYIYQAKERAIGVHVMDIARNMKKYVDSPRKLSEALDSLVEEMILYEPIEAHFKCTSDFHLQKGEGSFEFDS